MHIKQSVNQIKIFENIGSETMEKLLKVGSVQKIPKGTLLIRAREPIATIYFQLTGKSIVYNLTHSGKRKILFIFGS